MSAQPVAHRVPNAVPHHPDGTPHQLGRYRLLRPISSGGMARVFEGRREGLAGVSPRVAVKVILPDYAQDPAFHDLFINEARVGSLVRHQNLVQIQDFDQDQDRYYLVMEYVDGLTLRRVLGLCRKHGVPIPVGVIAEIGRQACDGLQHLHHIRDGHGRLLGLVHRDIKPSNLMVDPQGVVKILDYGVSRALSHQQKDGEVRGTWGYMSPEHAAGEEAGATSDLFGLAAVLYELAALSPVFSETKPDEIRALLASDEAARRAVALKRDPAMAPLVPLLVRGFQRDPAARFRDASDMGRALSALVGDPVLARERMVEFLRNMVHLARAGAEGRAMPSRADAPTPKKASQRPSARRESEPSQPRRVAGSRGKRPAPAPARESLVGYALIAVAVLIVGFTAWRLLSHESPVSPALVSATADAAPAALATVSVAPPDLALPRSSRVEARPAPVAEEVVEKVAEKVIPPAPVAAVSPVEAPADLPVDVPAEVPAQEASAVSLEVATGAGLVTISALPRAAVFVDGSMLRNTPLFQHELSAGAHTITLVADDGRRATFSLNVPSGGEARAVWDFDAGRLVDQR